MRDRTTAQSFLRLATLRRHWALAVFVALVVLVAIVPFVLALPDVYRASATILVEGQLFEAFGSDAPAVDSRLQAIKQEALSRARLTELVERFHLYDGPEQLSLAGALGRLQRDIQIEVTSTSQRRGEANTVSFNLSYVGSDPMTAAHVTNALASFYVAQNDKLRSRAITYRSEVLKVSLADAKTKLDAQEQRIGLFTSRNIGSLPQQITANQAALARVSLEAQANTNEQIRQRDRRQALLNQIFEVKANASPDDFDPETLLARRTKELAALRLNETDDSPNVRAKQREIRTLIDQMSTGRPNASAAATRQSRLAALQAELTDTEVRLQKLATEYDALRASTNLYQSRIENAPVRNAELDAIMLDYRAARDLYDSVQKRYDEAAIAERAEHGQGVEQFRIVDAAIPPTSAAGPHRAQLLAGGFALAVMLGLGLALLVDWFDTSFHSIYELRDFTHIPIMASIPPIRTRRDKMRRALAACAVAGVAAVFLVLIGSGAFRYGQRSDAITRTLVRLG